MSSIDQLTFLRTLKVVELRQYAKKLGVSANNLKKEEIVQELHKASGTKQYGQKCRKHSGGNPLFTAIKLNDTDAVKNMLEAGKDIKATNRDGDTPLILATKKNHENIVKLLLDKGADLDCENNYGETPITIAAEMNHVNLVKLLLDKGADPDADYKSDYTPLIYAIEQNNHTVVKMLLDKGANVECHNEYGDTPLILAVEQNHTGLVKWLLDKGANPNGSNNHSLVVRTPMLVAMNGGFYTVVKMLLDKGANVECHNEYGDTPLILAVEQNHTRLVKWLLDKGANPNGSNNDSLVVRTPMLVAMNGGFVDCCKLLLARKATHYPYYYDEVQNDDVREKLLTAGVIVHRPLFSVPTSINNTCKNNDKDDDGNYTCVISHEPLNPYRTIAIKSKSNGVIHCFDVAHILTMVETYGKKENPINRDKFTSSEAAELVDFCKGILTHIKDPKTHGGRVKGKQQQRVIKINERQLKLLRLFQGKKMADKS